MRPLKYPYWIETFIVLFCVLVFFVIGASFKAENERAYAAWIRYTGRVDVSYADWKSLNYYNLLSPPITPAPTQK